MVKKSSLNDLAKRTGKLARSVAKRAHRAGEQLRGGRLDLAHATLETIKEDIGEALVAARADGGDR
jgi:hypothetical protein